MEEDIPHVNLEFEHCYVDQQFEPEFIRLVQK